MDGARFANALAHLECAAADITWRAGVDALSFGATKNGALGAEAVIFFDPARGRAISNTGARNPGHLLSKMRFVSAQLDAYLDGRSVAAERRPRQHAGAAPGRGPDDGQGHDPGPCGRGQSGVRASARCDRRPGCATAGATFYDWAPSADGRTLVRLVTSFATPEADVAKFVEIACG